MIFHFCAIPPIGFRAWRVPIAREFFLQTMTIWDIMLAFREFSFGPDTETLRVAGVKILSTQTFEAFVVGRNH